MKSVVAALLALIAAPAAWAQNAAGDERFAAVTVAAGEGIEVVATNVAAPVLGGRPPAPCPLTVEFFGPRNNPIGSVAAVRVYPGASAAVPAAVPVRGLVRAQVAIVGDDPDAVCAVRSDLEIYNLNGGATRFIVPGSQCLGRAACAGALP